MKLKEGLKWRYATKKFDPSKKVSDSDLNQLKEAIQLSASSYGLQPYTVLIVKNEATRESLKPVSWGQTQITDASHLMVFCNHLNVSPADVQSYLDLKADIQSIDSAALSGYGDFMNQKISEMSSVAMENWTSKQAYIGLGNLLAACGELQIDACPMEGLEKEAYDEILGLKEKGMTTAFSVPIGYRSEEDASQHARKVRRPLEMMFQEV